jgi:ferrous iron transport protein A
MAVVATLLALTELPRRRIGVIADVRKTTRTPEALTDRLRELGFLDGEEICVVARAAAGGPLAVRVGETTFALRQCEAECILIRRAPG